MGPFSATHEGDHDDALHDELADNRGYHDDEGEHGHSHGLVDRSILRSRAEVRAVAASLAILAVAAGAQLAIFALSGSVALLADLIHNFGTR
jgi:Co/Zn/Cd efflux system component